MVDEGDRLARQLVHAPLLGADELDEGRGLAPVGGGEGEGPREDAPVGCRGLPVTHGVHRNLVHRGPRVELVGHAGGEGHDQRRPCRPFVLEALVALDTGLGVVAVLALLEGDLDAVDAAVAFVDQRVVVHKAVCCRDAVRRIRPSPVNEQGNELLVGRLNLTAREGHRGRHRKTAGDHRRGQSTAHTAAQDVPEFHVLTSHVRTRRAWRTRRWFRAQGSTEKRPRPFLRKNFFLPYVVIRMRRQLARANRGQRANTRGGPIAKGARTVWPAPRSLNLGREAVSRPRPVRPPSG